MLIRIKSIEGLARWNYSHLLAELEPYKTIRPHVFVADLQEDGKVLVGSVVIPYHATVHLNLLNRNDLWWVAASHTDNIFLFPEYQIFIGPFKTKEDARMIWGRIMVGEYKFSRYLVYNDRVSLICGNHYYKGEENCNFVSNFLIDWNGED